MRKVLILTYHFPPSAAVAVYRMIALSRYLPNHGWQPVIVAPPQVPWEPVDPSLLDQVPPETPVERVPFADGVVGKIIRRLAPESHWIMKARSACRRMIEQYRPEAVISSSPPGIVHMLGRWVQKRFGLPWIACFRDPWITNRIEPWRFATPIERWLEGKVMAHASRLVANTPENLRGWRAAYPDHADRMIIITNGFDPERFEIAVPRPAAQDRLTMLHAGEIYAGRDPRPFLDALQQLHAEPDHPTLDVDFVGRNTEQIFDLPMEIARRGLGAVVKSEGQVPYSESLQRMMRADILLLFQTPGYRLGVPAKLYEYLGAGRPVLAISELDSDIAWVLRESKVLHRIAAPMDVAGMKQAIRELAAEVQSGKPAQPDPAAIMQFTRERMAQRFAECLDAVAPRNDVPTMLAPAVAT